MGILKCNPKQRGPHGDRGCYRSVNDIISENCRLSESC